MLSLLIGLLPWQKGYNLQTKTKKVAGGFMIGAGSYLNVKITEGPVIFSDGNTAIFVRAPDLNVIEFTEPKNTSNHSS